MLYLSSVQPAVGAYFQPGLWVSCRRHDVTGRDTAWRVGLCTSYNIIHSYIEYATAAMGSRKATTNAVRSQSTINNVSFARYRRTCRGNDSRSVIWAFIVVVWRPVSRICRKTFKFLLDIRIENQSMQVGIPNNGLGKYLF